MKKVCTVVLSALMIFSLGALTGCGNSYSPDRVVVFAEYNGALGPEDSAVKAAVEKKFKQDTGLTIDLQIETAGTDMIGSKIITAMGDTSSQIDGFQCHYGSDSPINSYILDGLTKDLSSAAEEYMPHYLASFNETTDPGNLSYNSGVLGGKLNALSEKTRTSGWSMIIRKDYMEKTSFSPDDYDVTKPGYRSLSVEQFKQLVAELKSNSASERPIVGRPWSLDYFFTSPFGSVGYGEKVFDSDGNLAPAYSDPAYLKVLELYRWFQEEKLWLENPSSAPNILNYFISGKGAIYLDWPEVTSQVDVARSLKNATGADCIMLAPLLKDGSETETNGNSKVVSAFSGLAVPLKARNDTLLLKYIDWLYSDKANYELAKYGIEGKHWIRVEKDGVEYWNYPADKKSQYDLVAPYSGKYSLVSDYHISDLLYADFTDKENQWIDAARNFKCFPENGYATEGVLLPSVPTTNRKLRNIENAHYNEYVSLRAFAWSDAALPSGKTIRSMFETMRSNLYNTEMYFPLLEYYTQSYQTITGSKR